MYYKRIFLSFKLCIHLMKLYIFEAFLLLGSGYKRHIFMRIRIPNTKNKSIERQKKVLQWVLVYGLSKSVLRSRSWYFLVRAGAGVKIWRQKHFFYYFLAYFYMKRSRSRCKKVPGAEAGQKRTSSATLALQLWLQARKGQLQAARAVNPDPGG